MLACRKCMINTWRQSVLMSATFTWFRKQVCVSLSHPLSSPLSLSLCSLSLPLSPSLLSDTHTPLCFTSDKQMCQKQSIYLGKGYYSFNFSVTLRFFKIKS